MFFDLNIKGNTFENNLELAIEAKKYGWNHINFSYNQDNFKNSLEFKEDLKEELNDVISIDYTLEIKPKNVNEIRKISKKFRDKVNCISVVGGDLKINRAVCENIQLDVLSRPYLKRKDSGLNQVLAKEAFRNNVAVELVFNDILNSYLSHRAKIISNFKDIYTLHRKFNFPLILSSRAKDIFDIRSVNDFKAFFIATGLNKEEVLKAMAYPKEILDYNRDRKNLLFKGVRVVNNEA